MSIEHGVNGAAGRNLDLTRKAAQQAFADLASAPVRLLSLQACCAGCAMDRDYEEEGELGARRGHS